MSDLKAEGFKAGDILSSLSTSISSLPDAEKSALLKKTNGIFQLDVKSTDNKTVSWVIDMKKEGDVLKGTGVEKGKKPDVTISLTDEVFVKLAEGKVNAQRAFMSGQIKVKGNIMLATKLDGVLKSAKSTEGKAKL